MTRAEQVVARAQRAIGTPFRLHGRDRDGLDCVGLIGWAFAVEVPTGYRLRTFDPALVDRLAAAADLAQRAERCAGDLVVMASMPRQLHLAVATDTGFIHADAILRRVVERPGAPPWPIISCWGVEG